MKVSNVFFGLLAFVAIVAFSVVVSGAGLAAFVDIPGSIIVFAGSYLLTLMAHGSQGLVSAYRTAVRGGDRGDCLAAVEVFKGLSLNFLITGIFGAILGAIAMMVVFTKESQGSQEYTLGAALAILTIIYSLVGILFLSEPFRASAAAQAARAED